MSKPRASWNNDCDTILLDLLFEKRQGGLQTSNGNWHKSTWTTAQTRLAGSETGSGGSPKTGDSCRNRWDTLKRHYKEVKIIREISGFGWDEEKGLVTAEEDIWEKLLASHPTYKKWMTTAFPLFDEMADLMEGTYTTGKGVVRPGRNRTPNTALGSDSSNSDEESDPINPTVHRNSTSPAPSSTSTTSSTTIPTTLPTQETPTTVIPTSSKRQAVDTLESASTKRSRHSRKKSGSQAIEDMASSIDRLASAVATDAAIPSPVRKCTAIHTIEDDDDLFDDEQIRAFKIIRRDTGFADTINAIRKKDARTRFIKSELYPLPETSEA